MNLGSVDPAGASPVLRGDLGAESNSSASCDHDSQRERCAGGGLARPDQDSGRLGLGRLTRDKKQRDQFASRRSDPDATVTPETNLMYLGAAWPGALVLFPSGPQRAHPQFPRLDSTVSEPEKPGEGWGTRCT